MSRGPWINTWTGVKFYLADPRPEDISVLDIAHALARINRYTGHGQAYSVAQHCVLASKMANRHYEGPLHLAARMLIHDASEAYLNDISSPLKSLLPDYRRLESQVEIAIESAFDLLFLGDALVKEIDTRMLLTERPRQFLCTLPWDEDWTVKAEGLEPFPIVDVEDEYEWEPWSAQVAEEQYLTRFAQLLPWVEM